jgi:ribosome-associated translation inhibitor RaiA
MQIQINTDHHIEGHEALAAWATGEVKNTLSHHSDHITRVEVHLSDENGHKSGTNDKRCVMEGRLEGRQPMAVIHHAETLYRAVTGAADKLNRMIESTLGRAARTDSQAQPQPLPED